MKRLVLLAAALLLVSCGGGDKKTAIVQSASTVAVSPVELVAPAPAPKVLAASTRTAQVCLGPALPPATCFTIDTSIIGDRPFAGYVATRPKDLLFNVPRRRAELGALPAARAAEYCAANWAADASPDLPTISFGTGKVTIFETDLGGGHSRQSADMEFTNITTSDGFALPKFGFIWNQQRGISIVALQFRPSIDPNVAAIEGLTEDLQFSVDLSNGLVTFSRVSGLPDNLRRLILAVAYRLPSLYTHATRTETRAGNTLPLWTLSEVIDVATQFSHYGFSLAQPRFMPIKTLTCDLSTNGQTCAEDAALNQFRDYLIQYGADYLYSGRRDTAAGLLANLRDWAQQEGFTVYPGITVGASGQNDFRPKYSLQWFLVPTINTWAMLRRDPLVTDADRALIDGWIGRLVAYGTEPFGGPDAPYNVFNVGYLTLGTRMAWGLVTGSDVAVAEGVERFYMGLYQMRTDGSFPREVARGACALRYQDTVLLNMLFIAELAAEQGYDLYALNVQGKTVHTAVRFLLDAIDNPALVLAYSSEDAGNCVNATAYPIDTSTVVQTMGPGMTYSAWLEPYIARFPDHPNSARLKNLLVGGLEKHRPIYHPHSGGNTTCFSAESRPQLPTAKVDCLFNWASTNYPALFAPGSADTQAYGPYYYRYHAATQSHLGLSFADQNIYYLSAASGLVNAGPVTGWLAAAGCR
jgi:hypothetical protein